MNCLRYLGDTQRPGLLELIDFTLLWTVQKVCCEDLSRLSRDIADLANFAKKMDFRGVQIETIGEGVASELHIGFRGTMNALYLKDIKDKTKRGQIAKVLQGRVYGGRCYGYDNVVRLDEKGELVKGLRTINQDEAEIVREIFNLYLAGHSPSRIAQQLNQLNIPSPQGKKWHSPGILGNRRLKSGILFNNLYNGVITFNKMTYRKNPETGRKVPVPASEEGLTIVAIPGLKILEDGVFEQAQQRICDLAKVPKEKRILYKETLKKEKSARQRSLLKRLRLREGRNCEPPHIAFMKLKCAVCDNGVISYNSNVYRCKTENCQKSIEREDVESDAFEHMQAYSFEEFEQSVKRLREKRAALVIEIIEKEGSLSSENSKLKNLYSRPEENGILTEVIKECLSKREEISYEIRQARISLEELNLSALQDKSAEEIFKFFKEHLNKCIVDHRNSALLKDLYTCIDFISVAEKEYAHVTFNVPKILFIFGTLKKAP